ncbi:MAG: S8 family serine peptidase, partial [Pyrinomonadaceae bacterium]
MVRFRLKRARLISHFVILATLAFTTPLPRAQAQLLNLNQIVSSVKVSGDLSNLLLNPSSARHDVIIQLNGPLSLTLRTLIALIGGQITAEFGNFDMIAVRLPATSLTQLLNLPGILYVSPDRPTATMGHVTTTTGADAARTGLPLTPELNGSGVGIAILDSGIYDTHKSFSGTANNIRVVANKDFTGENRTDDPFGHGTHVASLAAGNDSVASGAYSGVASNANLLDVRVLSANGTGTTSGLLKGLNWVMSNRAQYNIRVANLSLGAPAVDSYLSDPICKAVRKLVDAGIVVVAAAGNNGTDDLGRKVYGQIHSPGIEPAALTVGASNSYGTDSRHDDTITTFSSRGPTRSSWT